MKQSFAFLLLLLCLNLSVAAQNAFEVMTPKPTPGSVINIEYMQRNTVLQGIKDFEATAYLLEGGLPRAVNVPLKQEGGIFRGSLKTADTTRAVFFSFAKDEKQDNNNDEGYYTVLYNKKGEVVPGANLAAGTVFSSYGGIWGLKRNTQKGIEFNKTEFALPAAIEKYYPEYLTYLGQSEAANKELLKAELAKQAAKKDISEADLLRVKNQYQFTLKDKEKADALMALIKERYPNGNWKRTEMNNKFFETKALDEKEKIFSDYLVAYGPVTKENEMVFGSMAGTLARMYADAGNWEAVNKYLAMVSNKSNKANTLNSIAWKLSGEGLNNKPLDVKAGLPLSEQSMTLMKEEMQAMSGKPPYMTDKQYQKNLESSYHMFGDTYATLLYHNGDYQKAYDVEKAAVQNNKRKDVSMNEAFALLTEKTKGPKAAQTELESFFEEGKYSPAMKEQLKRLYIAGGKTEAEWTAYSTNLEQMAYNKLKAELAKKMINMPAPQFALKNMAGEKVELASLKGKVVVVDFWATWCGPCIASFPGMQMAVNKFKNNPDVVFLFIDSWENDSNRVQKVTEFIAKNKYSFNVLYDEAKTKEGNEFVVIEEFKVEGIPTKFVIDRANNIRFKSVGFSGSADAIVAELTAMIDMANAESEGGKKGF